jgi:hypothetical protein
MRNGGASVEEPPRSPAPDDRPCESAVLLRRELMTAETTEPVDRVDPLIDTANRRNLWDAETRFM